MTEIWLESCFYVFHTMQRWEKLLGDPLLARISVSESTSYHMTALALVPDPMLLVTGPNYPPIQQVTENRGFNQIQNFFHRYTPVRWPIYAMHKYFFPVHNIHLFSAPMYFWAHKLIFQCTNLFLSAKIYFSVHKSNSQCTNVFSLNKCIFSAQMYFPCTNLFLSAQIYFSVHKCISQCTNLFLSAQMYFSVHKYIFHCTNVFLSAQMYFSVHKFIS